jgi:hypothetical protein
MLIAPLFIVKKVVQVCWEPRHLVVSVVFGCLMRVEDICQVCTDQDLVTRIVFLQELTVLCQWHCIELRL